MWRLPSERIRWRHGVSSSPGADGREDEPHRRGPNPDDVSSIEVVVLDDAEGQGEMWRRVPVMRPWTESRQYQSRHEGRWNPPRRRWRSSGWSRPSGRAGPGGGPYSSTPARRGRQRSRRNRRIINLNSTQKSPGRCHGEASVAQRGGTGIQVSRSIFRIPDTV